MHTTVMKARQPVGKSLVIMAGPFPPPIGGMALGNAMVRSRLASMGANLLIINLSPPNLDRRLVLRLRRIWVVLVGLVRIVATHWFARHTFYIRISGGLGQVYEACFMLIARMRGMRIFVSHHSFAYLNQRNLLTRALVALGGKRATHIALSENMAARLKQIYPGVGRVLIVSNAAVYEDDQDVHARERRSLRTVGFLSIVSEDKGVFSFLDAVAELEQRGLQVEAKLAGPFQDHRTERQVRERLEGLRSVEYVGGKYDKEKWQYFDGIDVLLFPTTFKYEAEPRTIHEALMCGIPVIANSRACIPDVLTDECGLLVRQPEQFVSEAVSKIEAWNASTKTFQKASCAARARYLSLRNASAERFQSLLDELCGVGAED